MSLPNGIFRRACAGIVALATLPACALVPSLAMAQPAPGDIWTLFGDGAGDAYSSVFLDQLFGSLFAAATGAESDSIFSIIVGYFNSAVIFVGGAIFIYNVFVGMMQTAHEGEILGARWSSLWAPLRVIIAVGMLVPVNNGYNLAQTGVAWIVQGATGMASVVWSVTARAVIDDDLPIAAPVTTFDPGAMSALYEQAACLTTLQAQISIANSNARVAYVLSDGGADGDGRHHYHTAIDIGAGPVDHGVCGSWSTPRSPRYLDNAIEGLAGEDGVAPARARELIDAFRDGHRDIMLDVAADMRAITDARYPLMMASDAPPPSIASEIAASHVDATAGLSVLVDRIRTLASGGADGVARPRDALLARVAGSGSCLPDGGPGEAASARSASAACYGEGWMGAGSWYILMARINNELSSLTTARASTTGPSYATGSIWPAWIFGGGSVADRFGASRGGGGDMPSVEQSVEAMEKYQDLFERSAIELAALGYRMPTGMLNEIVHDSESDASSFWRRIVPEDFMLEGTRAMLAVFDPGSGDDPMVRLITLGHWLVAIGSAILAATAVSGFFTGGGAAVALLPVYSILLAAGVSLSFILPIMPFLYWILAILGYFLLIAEAFVAVSLWALAHLRLDGEGLSGEAGRLGWLMLLALFLTPTLMVLGFVIGMTLFRVISDLISAGLFHAVAGIVGTNPIVWLFGTVGYSVLVVTAHGLLLERSFSLVSEFPNRVLRWIGYGPEVGGGEGRIQAAVGAAAVGAGAIGKGLERGMTRTSLGGRIRRTRGMGGRLSVMGGRFFPGFIRGRQADPPSEND